MLSDKSKKRTIVQTCRVRLSLSGWRTVGNRQAWPGKNVVKVYFHVEKIGKDDIKVNKVIHGLKTKNQEDWHEKARNIGRHGAGINVDVL